MREDAKRIENQPMGPASVNSNVGQLQVDVNMVNLDGTPGWGPFATPTCGAASPTSGSSRSSQNTTPQSVYRLDFSQDRGWSKWLGTQQLLGYYEYKDQKTVAPTTGTRRSAYDKGWQQKYAAANTILGGQTTSNLNTRYAIAPGGFSRLNEQYYVGNTAGGGIEYAPSYFPEGASVPYVWGPNAGAMIKDVSAVGYTPAYGGGLTISMKSSRPPAACSRAPSSAAGWSAPSACAKTS